MPATTRWRAKRRAGRVGHLPPRPARAALASTAPPRPATPIPAPLLRRYLHAAALPEAGAPGDKSKWYVYAHPLGPLREIALEHRRQLAAILGRARAHAGCARANSFHFPAAHCTLGSFCARTREDAHRAWAELSGVLTAAAPGDARADGPPRARCLPPKPDGLFVAVRAPLLARAAERLSALAPHAPQLGLSNLTCRDAHGLHVTLACDYGPLSDAQRQRVSALAAETSARLARLSAADGWLQVQRWDVLLWRRAGYREGAGGNSAGTWSAERWLSKLILPHHAGGSP